MKHALFVFFIISISSFIFDLSSHEEVSSMKLISAGIFIGAYSICEAIEKLTEAIKKLKE